VTATEPEHPAWWPAATHALHQAQLGRWDIVGPTLTQLDQQHGSAGILGAMLAWIDTLAHESGFTGGEQISAAFIHTDTACESGSTAEERAAMRWVGRLIEARVGMDQDAFDAVLDETIESGDIRLWNDNVGHLLTTVAINLNQLQGRPDNG